MFMYCLFIRRISLPLELESFSLLEECSGELLEGLPLLSALSLNLFVLDC